MSRTRHFTRPTLRAGFFVALALRLALAKLRFNFLCPALVNDKVTDERPAASGDFTARTSGLRFGRTDRTDKLPGAGATKDNCARALGPPAC